MGKLRDVPFAVQEGNSGIRQNSQERLVNMFVEMPVSGRSKLVRRQRACLNQVYAIAGEKRCIEEHKGNHYCIIADTLYSFDGTTLTSLGTLGTTTGRCTMIFNDLDQIMISDRAVLYYWNGTILATVTIPSDLMPGDLAYLNGYGIVNNQGTGIFYVTAANDFSNIDPLDFATAESNPDALVTVFTDHNELWLLGKKTIEIWQDVGGTDFPFQAVTSAKIERGCAASLSLAADDNTVIMYGNDGVIYRFDGYRPVRISTTAIEDQLRRCSVSGRANAYAVIYTIGGNKFYTLTVPNELTRQYNFATNLWNEANTYGSDSWDMIGSAGHYADYVMSAAGICALSPDINTDELGIVVRKAVSAPGWADGRLITMTEMIIDCEVGRAAIGVDATIMLRIARNGETFGNIRTVSLGATGEYDTRPRFGGMGQGRKPVLELSASGDFNLAIMGTLLNASAGNS